eukprot:TRINITY_DN20292_c0_g1_i1.p1 TRINITY_DN20292_c0_g1~~TRINITY_DN20292_c0_g1_i1.p1  ORF type:complete len:239 (-),score=29.49 TRINITY_DN20292_c0_g1_i1:131-847(-)
MRACPLTTASFARSTTATMTVKRVLKGVIFDMDGTLTVPCIDFGEMRRRVGVRTGVDLLAEIDSWSPTRQQAAYLEIEKIEEGARINMEIMKGAKEICHFLDTRRIRRGLITRNVKKSVDHLHSILGVNEFSPALSREFRPYKPDSAPLLHICSVWGVSPSEVMMVGDSAHDDVACGKTAGAVTCLLDETRRFNLDALPDGQRPDYRVHTLREVEALLRTRFHLHPVPDDNEPVVATI